MSEPFKPIAPEDVRAPELPAEDSSANPLFARVREKTRPPVPKPVPERLARTEAAPEQTPQVALTEADPELLNAQIFCRECGRYAEQGGYAVLLCGECRRAFAFRPFSLRALAALAALALVAGIAFVRLPGAVAAGVAFERGWRAERSGDLHTAAAQYRIVVRRYPNATHALVRLAVASAQTGNVDETRIVLDKLSGRTLSNDVILELNRAEAKLRKSLEAQ